MKKFTFVILLLTLFIPFNVNADLSPPATVESGSVTTEKDLVTGTGLTGGANDVLVGEDGDVTISTVQDIATTATPSFSGINLTDDTDLNGNDLSEVGNLSVEDNITSDDRYQCGAVTSALLNGAPVVYDGTDYLNTPAESGCASGYILFLVAEGEPSYATCDSPSLDISTAYTDPNGFFDDEADIYVAAVNLPGMGMHGTFYFTNYTEFAAVVEMLEGSIDAYEVAFSWNSTTCEYDTETLSTVSWYTDTCSGDDANCPATTFPSPSVTVTASPIYSFNFDATTKSLTIENDITAGNTISGSTLNGTYSTITDGVAVGENTELEVETNLNQAGVVIHKTYTDYDESLYAGPGEPNSNYVRSGLRIQTFANPATAYDGSGYYQITYGLQNLVMSGTANNIDQVYGSLNQAYVSGDGQTAYGVTGVNSQIGTTHANATIASGYLYNASIAFALGTHTSVVGYNVEDLTTNAVTAWGIKSATDMLALDNIEWVFGTDSDIRIGHNGTAGELTIADGVGDQDIKLLFNGTTNDGTITYMEDEDLFNFDESITTSAYLGLGVLADAPGSTNGIIWVESDGIHAYYGDTEHTLGVSNVVVEDDAYGSGWDDDTTNAPSQNAVYDILNQYDTDDDGDIDNLDSGVIVNTECTLVSTFTDDAINTAIDALTDGGCVQLLEGEYVVDTGIVITKSNITIQGVGWSSILKIPTNTNTGLYRVLSNRYAAGADPNDEYAVNNLTLKDFAIDGNNANQSSGDHNGIEISGMDNVMIDHLYIHDLLDRPIRVQDNKATGLVDPDNLTIKNCTLDRETDTDQVIYITDASDVFITSNKIMNGDTAIIIYLNDGKGIITNNVFTNVNGAIYTGNSIGYYVIANNDIYASGGGNDYGIQCLSDKSVIQSNNIYNTLAAGIYIDQSDYVLVSNNLLYECGNEFNHTLINSGDYNLIIGNSIIDTVGTHGIYIMSNSDNSVISNNYVNGANAEDIEDDSSPGDSFISFNASSANRYLKIGGGGGTGGTVELPDRLVHIEGYTTLTNTVDYPLRIGTTTNGTPAASIGVGLEAEIETAADNYEVGGTLEFAATDVGNASEDFDFIVKLMAGGSAAAQMFKVDSTGTVSATDYTSGSGTGSVPTYSFTSDPDTGMYNGSGDVLSFSAGTETIMTIIESGVDYVNFARSVVYAPASVTCSDPTDTCTDDVGKSTVYLTTGSDGQADTCTVADSSVDGLRKTWWHLAGTDSVTIDTGGEDVVLADQFDTVTLEWLGSTHKWRILASSGL